MKKKTVYIAIEIKVREFISQVFLSSLLIKKGFRVYLGSKNQILNLIDKKKNKGGIFFYKAGVAGKFVDLVNDKTDKHVIFDQEMLPGVLSGQSAKKWYLENINPFSVNGERFCDAYLATNKLIYESAKKGLTKMRGKIYQTGSPRIDMWKQKYHYIFNEEVKKIKKKYGKFFLFNSDYQFISGNIKEEVSWFFFNPKDLKEWSSGKNKDIISREFKRAEDKYKEFNKFVPFIKKLSKKTNKKIVIRPHPIENKFIWKKLFKRDKNIFIEDPIKDVFPWILASDGLLHRGCTTALQSLMMGKPTFFIDLGNEFKKNYNVKIFSYNNSIKIKKNFKKSIFSNLRKNSVNKKRRFLNYLGVDINKDSAEKILNILNNYKINKEEKIIFKNNILNEKIFLSYIWLKKILYRTYLFVTFQKKLERNDLGRYDKIYGGINKKEVNYYLKKLIKRNYKVESVTKDIVMIEYR